MKWERVLDRQSNKLIQKVTTDTQGIAQYWTGAIPKQSLDSSRRIDMANATDISPEP